MLLCELNDSPTAAKQDSQQITTSRAKKPQNYNDFLGKQTI